MPDIKNINEVAPLAVLKGLAAFGLEETPGGLISYHKMISQTDSEKEMIFLKKYFGEINHTVKVFYRKLRKSVQSKPDKYFTLSKSIVEDEESLEELHVKIINSNYSVLELLKEQSDCKPGQTTDPISGNCVELGQEDETGEVLDFRTGEEKATSSERISLSGEDIKSDILRLIPRPGPGSSPAPYMYIPFLAAMSPGFGRSEDQYRDGFNFEQDFSEQAVKNFARSISRTVRKKFQCENRFAAVMIIAGYMIEEIYYASAEQFQSSPGDDPGTSSVLKIQTNASYRLSAARKMTDVGTTIRRYFVERFFELSQQPPDDDIEAFDKFVLNFPGISLFTSPDSVMDRCGKPISGNITEPKQSRPSTDSDGEIETSQYGTPVTRDGDVSPPGNFGRAERAGLPSPKF